MDPVPPPPPRPQHLWPKFSSPTRLRSAMSAKFRFGSRPLQKSCIPICLKKISDYLSAGPWECLSLLVDYNQVGSRRSRRSITWVTGSCGCCRWRSLSSCRWCRPTRCWASPPRSTASAPPTSGTAYQAVPPSSLRVRSLLQNYSRTCFGVMTLMFQKFN